ncbi:MAG: hypothetical protein Q8P82_00680 [bacterium]|nr:hypothetical protein [bacterium]
MRVLSPHGADPSIELIEPVIPRIILGFEAFRDTNLIIEASPVHEVGWLGTVEKLDSSIYRINEVFILAQEVSGTHCEFTPTGLAEFYQGFAATVEGRKQLGSLLFWGHLHPGNMVDPSGQDEEQMVQFNHNECFIRGIFTRNGQCKFTFFDYKRGIKIVDCPWTVDFGNAARREEIRAELVEKVRTPDTTRKRRHGSLRKT